MTSCNLTYPIRTCEDEYKPLFPSTRDQEVPHLLPPPFNCLRFTSVPESLHCDPPFWCAVEFPLPFHSRVDSSMPMHYIPRNLRPSPERSLPASLHSPFHPDEERAVPPPRHSRPLYACSALPPVDDELHPILRVSGVGNHLDVLRDPSGQVPEDIHLAMLDEPATVPGLRNITLICPRLPWRIDVHNMAGGFVSAADVRWSIHSALLAPVTDTELESTPIIDRPIIWMAFEERCDRMLHDFGPGAAELERGAGIKRVDFLFGSHRFMGLSPTAEAQDIWEMTFSS